ncbi:hypothetical protein MalM25_26090 [Planctomycetes bacterium MalM25]|nr:hypothetical protein MalM25_26090 [Planctomycetes bacterium MalM25]
MRRSLFLGLLPAIALIAAPAAAAPNTADATLELTITLTGVTITDTVSGTSFPAVFETSNEVGDLLFEDAGPNGFTADGGSSNNPPGSVGSGGASETVLLNGIDLDEGEYDMDSFGIGDSLVTTMEVSATAETPGSVFFAQVNSENTLWFSHFGADTDQFTFSFDYSATLTGSLDTTGSPGVTSVTVDDAEVIGGAEDTLSGSSISFLAASDFASFASFNDDNTVENLDELASGTFDVAFDAGDNALSITFASSLVVNAGVEDVLTPLEGDFNGDGEVNAADYTVWRDNESGGFTPGDYDTWRLNYGATASSTVAVPEPGALLLTVLAFAASSLWRPVR